MQARARFVIAKKSFQPQLIVQHRPTYNGHPKIFHLEHENSSVKRGNQCLLMPTPFTCLVHETKQAVKLGKLRAYYIQLSLKQDLSFLLCILANS